MGVRIPAGLENSLELFEELELRKSIVIDSRFHGNDAEFGTKLERTNIQTLRTDQEQERVYMGQVVATTSWGEKNGPLIGLFSPPCEVNITYIIGRWAG